MQNENLVQPVNLPDPLSIGPVILPYPVEQVKPERVRFSAKERIRILEALKLLNGPGCHNCGTVSRLEIHHKNGLADSSLASLQLLCKVCHLMARNLKPIASDGLVSVSVSKSEAGEDALEKNGRIEPAWIEFVGLQLQACDPEPMKKDLLTGMSAHYVDCSVATVTRYWKKHACPLGPFELYRPKTGTQVLVRLRRRPSE